MRMWAPVVVLADLEAVVAVVAARSFAPDCMNLD